MILENILDKKEGRIAPGNYSCISQPDILFKPLAIYWTTWIDNANIDYHIFDADIDGHKNI